MSTTRFFRSCAARRILRIVLEHLWPAEKGTSQDHLRDLPPVDYSGMRAWHNLQAERMCRKKPVTRTEDHVVSGLFPQAGPYHYARTPGGILYSRN